MNIKLIALDMDGTTLDDNHQVTPENMAAINAALQQDIHVIVSTGRSNAELLPVLQQLPQLRYFSCANGAKIYDRALDSNIFEDMLPFEHAVTVLDSLKDFDVLLEIYANNEIYAESYLYENIDDYLIPELKPLIRRTRTPLPSLGGFLQQWQKPVEKFNVFFNNPADRSRIAARIEQLAIALTHEFTCNLDVTSPTASKGTALGHLCQQFGIKANEVMAIGDGHNDISMLEFAGCSVAMANAVPAAKAAAKFHTQSNHASGVAASIRQHALN